MDLLYVTHPDFARHETGDWHPERPARLRAVARGVAESGLGVIEVEAPEVDRDHLETVHKPAYVAAVERFVAAGGGELDPDTVVCEHSWSAAVHAAGAGIEAVRLLQPGQTAFLATRPPGHHALPDRAMGFCLFNNVAVTARHLTNSGHRVAIVDWDVHHGNGTEAIFCGDPDVLYMSVHQHPFYPFEGELENLGDGDAVGTNLNLPVPAFTAGDVYTAAFRDLFSPVLSTFKPDWILVSCGYDAHEGDPLAELRLESADYGWLASQLTAVVPPHRIVVFLEGGYHLPAITESVAATLRGLGGETFPEPTGNSPEGAWANFRGLFESARSHWEL